MKKEFWHYMEMVQENFIVKEQDLDQESGILKSIWKEKKDKIASVEETKKWLKNNKKYTEKTFLVNDAGNYKFLSGYNKILSDIEDGNLENPGVASVCYLLKK